MIAAGGAGDREVRYVIRIAADPGNAAVVARETATLRAFEQRVASAGRSLGGRLSGGGAGVTLGGGGNGGGLSLGGGGGAGTADLEARIADMRQRTAALRANIGTLEAGGMGAFGMPGVGVAIGGIAAMGALSLGATKALVDPAGTSEAVGGWGVWGADKYASLMNWFGRFSPEGRLAEERGEYIADYFGNRKTAFLAQRGKAQERFRAARDLWSNRNLDLAGQRRQVEFEAALARGRVTGDFSGANPGVGAARRALDSARGSAVEGAANNYVEALERESQLIRENASAREVLSQKMGDEIAKLGQLQAARGNIAERYLQADPAGRALINRALRGEYGSMTEREVLAVGRVGFYGEQYNERILQLARERDIDLSRVDPQVASTASQAEKLKQQLETGLGRSLGPLNEAFAKAGEAIGEIVAKEIAKNQEQMAEAVQKAIDASAAKNVNRGQAMLRRSQQVGLA